MSNMILKRLLKAFLTMLNANSSTMWLGPVNWIMVWAAQHLNLTPDQASGLRVWLLSTGAVVAGRLLSKIFNGAFPSITFGIPTPASPSAPAPIGAPVMAIVPKTAGIKEDPTLPNTNATR